jgi:hypothetical protein
LGDLVDVGVFEEAGRIEQALRRGEVKEALSWCAENKNALKKTNVGPVAYTNLWRYANGCVIERTGVGIASTAID